MQVFCLVVAAAVQGEQLSYEQRDDIGIALKMVGFLLHAGDLSVASKSTQHDRTARPGTPSRTTNYGVFLAVS
ncbi:hypothetical protein Y032_0013g2007 [Ancylostoma ceylanicum]|nr:hypothetical protein Y032_0013g2007 [Ancylostoma ceylanicum]